MFCTFFLSFVPFFLSFYPFSEDVFLIPEKVLFLKNLAPPLAEILWPPLTFTVHIMVSLLDNLAVVYFCVLSEIGTLTYLTHLFLFGPIVKSPFFPSVCTQQLKKAKKTQRRNHGRTYSMHC